MKLAELLAQFPAFSLATRENNDEILAFFNQTSMNTPLIDIQYNRGPDFFSFLQKSSSQYFVLIARDKSGKLGFVASLIIRKGRINNKNTDVGYLGDLRIAPKLELVVAWKKLLSILLYNLSQIEELNGLKYLITAVMDENSKAINSLIKKAKNEFIYRKLSAYRMVNVFAKVPFYQYSNKYHIGFAKQDDRSTLTSFLKKQNQYRAFGFSYDGEQNELSRRLNSWDNFTLEQFILVKNQHKQIIACVAPHNPSPHKSILVKSISWKIRVLLKPISLIKPMPKAGMELNIAYLTHLEIANDLEKGVRTKVFNNLLAWTWQQGVFVNAHIVAFCDFERTLQEGLKGFIYTTEPMSLYQVYHHEHENLLQEVGAMPPGFEMALV